MASTRSGSIASLAEADVAKAMFYNHFRGKDELVGATIRLRDEWESEASLRSRSRVWPSRSRRPRRSRWLSRGVVVWRTEGGVETERGLVERDGYDREVRADPSTQARMLAIDVAHVSGEPEEAESR